MKKCAWCNADFDPVASYQIYCGAECRKEATREKVRERGRIALIRRRAKTVRLCANGCGTRLSVYNTSKICQGCATNNKLVTKALDSIKDFFTYEDNR